MRRRAIEVEVILFDILAMVALAIGQAEQSFLQDRIFAVPKCQSETELLPVVGNSGEAVFTPIVSSGTSLVVAEVIPGIAVLAVIFAHRAPLALAQIRSP